MTCSDCPADVVATIADSVQAVLDRIRAVKALTNAFNAALAGLGDAVLDDLTELVNSIPLPTTLDLSSLLGYLLCPLTPVALSIDPLLINGGYKYYADESQDFVAGTITIHGNIKHGPAVGTGGNWQMTLTLPSLSGVMTLVDVFDIVNITGHFVVTSDTTGLTLVSSKLNYLTGSWSMTFSAPVTILSAMAATYVAVIPPIDRRVLAVRFRDAGRAKAAAAQTAWTVALDGLKSANVVKMYQLYLRELARAVGDPAQFAIDYALAFTRSNLVKVLCPDIYSQNNMPFEPLVEELSNWSYDGTLPSNLDPRALNVANHVAAGEAKLAALRAAGTVIV